MSESSKLAVLVHHNNEVTILDERGHPNVCRDCRFSGWRRPSSYRHHSEPPRCLHYSGGADPVDGDRILNRLKSSFYDDENWEPNGKHGRLYPHCKDKNPDGKCSDFVRAKPLPWWGNFWRKILGREWRSKKMRL